MSEIYKDRDLRDIANDAERDLASDKLKTGASSAGYGGKDSSGGSDSSM
jgi:hypothetical protein